VDYSFSHKFIHIENLINEKQKQRNQRGIAMGEGRNDEYIQRAAKISPEYYRVDRFTHR
jgi:hypothetical protein